MNDKKPSDHDAKVLVARFKESFGKRAQEDDEGPPELPSSDDALLSDYDPDHPSYQRRKAREALEVARSEKK